MLSYRSIDKEHADRLDEVNMKVITAIYLNCRPELRDEWLAGQDLDVELEDALVSWESLALGGMRS